MMDETEDEEEKTKGSDWPGPRIGRRSKKRRKMSKVAKKGTKRTKRRKKK
jgi:hypothetical protein